MTDLVEGIREMGKWVSEWREGWGGERRKGMKTFGQGVLKTC